MNKILQWTLYSYYLTFQLSSYVLIERSWSFTSALKACLRSAEASYNNTPQWTAVSLPAAATQGNYFLVFLQIVEEYFHKQLTEGQSYASLATGIINYSLLCALESSDYAKLSQIIWYIHLVFIGYNNRLSGEDDFIGCFKN